jgi:iron complex transport system permease protein
MTRSRSAPGNQTLRWLLLLLLLGVAALLSLSIGPTGFSLSNASVLANLRLPRLLLGVAAGGVLAFSGTALQGLLGNPLVDPYTLGVANGAALGTTLGVVLGNPAGISTPLLAIAGAMVTLLAVYAIAQTGGKVTKTGLVLSGVIVGFFLSGLVMLLMVFARRPLDQTIYLLMGNLDIVLTPTRLWLLIASGVAVLGALAWLYGFARSLNIMATNEEVAETLGVNTQSTTRTVFALSSLLVGISVAFTGVISFVGLVVPHLARLIFGPDHARTMPAAFLLGACLLLLADILARLTTPVLPLSVVTAFLGVPFFIYLFRTR